MTVIDSSIYWLYCIAFYLVLLASCIYLQYHCGHCSMTSIKETVDLIWFDLRRIYVEQEAKGSKLYVTNIESRDRGTYRCLKQVGGVTRETKEVSLTIFSEWYALFTATSDNKSQVCFFVSVIPQPTEFSLRAVLHRMRSSNSKLYSSNWHCKFVI